MKKIVFVMEQLFGGGAERVTATLMNEFCRDTEVHLITTYCYDHNNDYHMDARIIRHFCDAESKNRAVTLLKRIVFLRKTIVAIAPLCVVSLAGCGTNALLTTALWRKNIPLVLSERNDPVRFPESKIERMLREVCYSMCDGLVFQTTEARSFFSRKMQDKSVVISNPITGNLPLRYEGIREPRIVNCCRLTAQKNLDLLIEAFSDIAGEFPELVLQIYGEGPERTRLDKKIHTMQLDGKVFLPGYTDKVFEKIRKASIFVSSSDYEGISNSMLEAIALGVPSICTDCPAGSAREAIRHGENGMLVPVRNREAMANAMRTLLRDPEKMAKMSQEACRLREEISAQKIAGKWMAYIDEICAK